MYPRRSFVRLILSTGLGFAGLALPGGCGSDSRTTGTQVQLSPEVKAELADMKSAQKELRAERKKARGAGRARGKPAG